MYRDASNYKQWGQVTFSNPEKAGTENLDYQLRRAMMIDSTFIASQIRVPDVFLFNTMRATEDDHCLHEFDSLEIGGERSNDHYRRSILEFVREVERVALHGWEGFIPSSIIHIRKFKLVL
jgi:hypothetical protein